MEKSTNHEIAEQGSPEVPSLIKYISSNEVAGFDNINDAVELQFLNQSAKVRLQIEDMLYVKDF